MLNVLFVLAVIVGFILWFLASWPTPPYTERAARFCFMVAAILWGIGAWGGR